MIGRRRGLCGGVEGRAQGIDLGSGVGVRVGPEQLAERTLTCDALVDDRHDASVRMINFGV